MKKIVITYLSLLVTMLLITQNCLGSVQAVKPNGRKSIPQKTVRPAVESVTITKIDSIMCMDSIILSKIDGLQRSVEHYSVATSDSAVIYYTNLDKQVQLLIDKSQRNFYFITVLLIIIILLSILYVNLFLRYKEGIKNQTKKGVGVVEIQNKEEQPVIPQEEPEVKLTESDIVAYDDAIQAFVNINSYISDLRKYNKLITPYILWLASEDQDKPSVDFSDLPDEDRAKVALLSQKIEQFKKNNLPAINRFLRGKSKQETYADCLRCPIMGGFDPNLDQHLLDDDIEEGDEITAVFKLGFFFPESKHYPYREKSLII